jgi:hypothetical protein
MSMLTAPVPDLLIRTLANQQALLLSGPRLRDAPVVVHMVDRPAVRELHARFVNNLVRFRQLIGDGLSATPARAAAALVELAEAGRVFMVSVFDSVEDVHLLADCFRRACPTWRAGGRHRPIQIQSYGRLEEHLPWELLPVFEPRHVPTAATVADLDETCRPFGGFAALVERRTPIPVPARTTFDGTHGLGVRFFYHAGFDGAHAELGFLRAHADRIRLRGPYPDGDRPGVSIGQQLRDPTLDGHGTPTGQADHVVHFACHCDTVSPAAEEYAFHLADQFGTATRMTVRQLLNEIVVADRTATPDGQLPVVFVNACDSAALDPRCGTGLLTPFAKNGNLALIGTVAAVPDELASSFSQRFYTELLAGQALGAAMFDARRHLLLQHANPLAILYCLYGNAELRVLPIVPSNAVSTGGRR